MRYNICMLKWLRPHRKIHRIEEIDCRALLSQGIRGIMIDLDNTPAHWHNREVSPAVAAWFATLWQAGLRACMVTNAGHVHRVRPVASRLRLPWVIRVCKPLSRGFLTGMRLLETGPEQTAVVGDMLFTDILGGNRLGLLTILVDPLSHRESFFARHLLRPLERLIGREPKSSEEQR